MKIISYIWFLRVLTFLFAVVTIGASKSKDVELRCYSCPEADNTTDCNPLTMSQVKCTPEQLSCGTIAKSPDYISSLGCIAEKHTPCALIQAAKNTYEMTCSCDGDLCNRPFTREFQSELLNFSPTNLLGNTTRQLLEVFLNSSVFANITSAMFYKAITVDSQETSNVVVSVPPTLMSSNTLVPSTTLNVNIPRAEALKQEATAPSDDDEDEGEGSGSLEDVKPQAPAAPAAPSSFLPANDNKAIPMNINLLATVPFFFLYTMA